MSAGLTPRLAQLLRIIDASIRANGYAPAYADMAAALGIRSRGAVCAMVDRLEQRGFITRQRGTARSIAIVDQSGLSPALETEIAAYCRRIGITRPVFDQRAAERLLRGRP